MVVKVTNTSFKETEVSIIPNNWEIKTIEEITECLDHLRIPLNGSQRAKMQGNHPYCGANGVLDYVNDYVIDDEFILIAEDGGHFYEYATRPIAYKMKGKCWVNNHAHILKSKKGFDQSFIFYSLVHKNILRYLAGGTRAKLNKSEMFKIELNIPKDYNEQQKIAQTLSDVDELIKQLDYLITKKKNIKQGTMQELLTGKRRLEGFNEDWKEFTIASLCKSFTKQTGFDYTATIKPNLVTRFKIGVIPFIQNKNFKSKKINFDTDYFIPEDVANNFPRLLLDEQCLLISISENIGNIGLISNVQKSLFGGDIAVAKFIDKNQLEWVFYYLLSNDGQNILQKNVKASSHSHLILADIRKITIPMPEPNEQFAITQILSDMDKEIQDLESHIEKYQKIKHGMMQKLLTGEIRLK